MGIDSAGGALLPYQNQRLRANVTIDGTLIQKSLPQTTLNIGTLPGSTVTAVEYGDPVVHQTVLTLTNLAMSINDTHVGGGSKIYTFPKGHITVLDANCSVAETTTSTLASTLNTGVTLSVGVGSVQTTTQDSGTLATTQQDVVNQYAVTASATINVPGAAAMGKITATTLLRYDGSGTATALYLNCGVPTATDIDGDATSTWSGTVTVSWVYGGAQA